MTQYTIDPDRYAAIDLKQGSHDNPDEGLCLNESVAYLVGEKHTAHPKCMSPVLTVFGMRLNDALPDDLRQELKGLIPSLPGTAGDGWDESRSYMALDWLIRVWLPTWLELSPSCRGDAQCVRELGRVADLVSAERAGQVVRTAQTNADAARDAARDAAGDAAGAAAWAAAWDAAGAAAGDAAWAAAWDAAGAAAWDAAWAAAGAAARDAAGDAARARDSLAPTVRELQLSAIDLFAEMIKAPYVSGPDSA